MNLLSLESLTSYWSAPEVAINIVVLFNLLGALLLGMLVGYERSYHGRAAGMRTYGLVCMASAALTVLDGYPTYWYGGQVATFVGADNVLTGLARMSDARAQFHEQRIRHPCKKIHSILSEALDEFLRV